MVMLLCLLVLAQGPPAFDIDPVDQLKENFYGALDSSGKGVSAKWSAPNKVSRDAEFVLTLTISGAANPHKLVRPDLRKFSEFTQRFQLLDNPDHTEPAADPSATEVRFNYRLTARTVGKVKVPSLTYRYLRPQVPRDGDEKQRFPTTYANSISIDVKAPDLKGVAARPATPIEAPEEFFTLAADESKAWSPGLFAWLLPVSAVPLVVGGWLILWRVVFPDAARLAKLRRNRATRTALDRLKKARASADPAGAAAFAFRQYLTARFGVPPSAQTPTEVSAALRDLEQPSDRAADAEAFLRACDATRFDQSGDSGVSFTHQAEALITSWEGGVE
jgi:hypothetical protein